MRLFIGWVSKLPSTVRVGCVLYRAGFFLSFAGWVFNAPFAIGPAERDQRKWCMHKALDEMEMHVQAREYLKNHFTDTTEFLRNRS
ncbi:MAG: hypothetical protein IT314_05565 [Anaerolineales bacterium]|nr:hypothetical protein [Anaerolineales bacterium]